jgi:hypothetical protein
MATTTNYGWDTPDDTDLVKDGASAIRTLGSSIDTTVYNNSLAAIAKSIVDAKADIIVGTAADTVARLGVGANGTILTADSTVSPTGLKWATPASGGKLLQVIGATTTTEVINNTNTYADTTLTATITPSAASSKIMVLITQNGFWTYSNFANNAGQVKIVRASTDIWATQFINYDNAAQSKQNTYSFVYLDSPSTTSATTYKTQFRNVQNQQGVIVQESTAPSSIILLEIGA